jgi:hypothetical protein
MVSNGQRPLASEQSMERVMTCILLSKIGLVDLLAQLGLLVVIRTAAVVEV